MGRQEAQFVRRGPAHVACLATAARLGLLDGALDGDDDVAEVRTAAGREREVGLRGTARRAGRGPGMIRERLGRQQRERQHVGRAGLPQMCRVERCQLGVVGQDQPDRGRRWGACGRECGSDRACQRRSSDRRVDAVADGQVDPPGAYVQRPGHDAGLLPPLPPTEPPPPADPPPAAARRDSSSTTVFCGYAMRLWYIPSSWPTNASRISSRSRSVRSHSSN